MRAVLAVRLALIPAFAAAVALAAGSAPGVHAQAGARERTLFVSAVDSRGEPVEGLGPDDFVVTGMAPQILRVSRAISDGHCAAGRQRLGAPSHDARRTPGLRGQDGGDHQVAIIALADRPTIFVDYTSSPTRLQEGVGRLFSMSSSGMTLLDALVETSAGLRRREATRAVIVPIITTGTEFTNRYGRDVIASLQQAGVALHAIVIGVLDFASISERERAIVLDTGTRDTGGQHVTLLIDSAVGSRQKLARQLS
jgi:hypothetical protein